MVEMPRISRSLEWFKEQYGGRVTFEDPPVDVTNLMTGTRNRKIRWALDHDHRVFALPLYGGHGMLRSGTSTREAGWSGMQGIGRGMDGAETNRCKFPLLASYPQYCKR